MDYRKKLLARPGDKIRLKDYDPGWHGAHADEKAAAEETARHLDRITRQQILLYGERKHSLLIVLQGIDAAGKDGTCWHVISAMNPQGVTVTPFKVPTPEEHAHDFLWRVHPHAPALGRVAVFNRSHYESVLVERVHSLVPKSVWSKRYDAINAFEDLLQRSGATILKFFLWISPEEQLRRFGERWRIRRASGRSATRTIPSARSGTTTSPPSRRCCASAPRSGRPGSSSPRTTSGSATSPSPRSSPRRWRI